MTNEIENIELTDEKVYELTHKSDACANAFYEALLNQPMEVNIAGIGWKPVIMIDSSQYVIIVQPLDEPTDTYWQISKSHIVCIRSNVDFVDKYEELVVKGVRKILFDAEKKRKFADKPKQERKPFVKQQVTPTIQYKQKRTY